MHARRCVAKSAIGRGGRVYYKSKTGWFGEVMKDKTQLTTTGGNPRHRSPGDPLGANSEIGRKLKQYYDDLVSDEVPDRFAQLLAQLEQAEPSAKKG